MRSRLKNKRVENIKQAHRFGGFVYTMSRDVNADESPIGVVISVQPTHSRRDIAIRLIDARRSLHKMVEITKRP